MKKNQVFIFVSLTLLFSCTNVKQNTLKSEAKSNAEVTTQIQVPKEKSIDSTSAEPKKHEDVLQGINYSFSNESLCQSINIKEVKKSEKFKMPEKLKFTLTLHDKQHKYDDKIFEGVALLSSPEESFLDASEKDGGAYDAADYNFDAIDYKIKIRLDIQSYEACVVSITTSRPDTILGSYTSYLKKFPNDGVMKKGVCK